MDETLTTEDVVASFQQDFGTAQTAQEPAPASAPSEQTDPPAQPGDGTATETQTEQEQAPAQPTTPPATEQQTPDSKAFASMRVQNKQMQELLVSLAKQQGIDGKPEEIIDKLREHTLLEQAKKEGIPEPVAKELAKLREQAQNYEQFQVQQMARIGFQKVKNDFGLSSEQLEAFADQLVKEGLNPFREQLDLPMEYLKRNFASLIKQAEERGAATEGKRLAKVDAQSTAPNTKSSVGNSSASQQPQINSVAELEAFMANLKT